ncbi:MAG: Na+/H+ antiporter NhaA [Saprospiraceae bacterium]|nr:Na+/H+ antiporter NhaA [Saprospiraceae bacterium]
MNPTKLFSEFFESEKAGGLILIVCTLISLMIANSAIGPSYQHLWHVGLFSKSFEFWIHDGLMTLFFLLVGLEIEREIYVGEFSETRKAMLPIMAAIGGMAVPAAIHFGFNHGTPFENGFGIPMATDIAFSLGILSLLGKRVPLMLKVFLTALAIIDDLGAIIIIALFYSDGVNWLYLGLSGALFAFLILLNRRKINRLWIFLSLGVVLWYCLYQGGVHPTITGVLLAFTIPFGDGKESSLSYRLQHFLHKPVAFLILPVFALVNTTIVFPADFLSGLAHANPLGIMLGLVVGKPAGILAFSMIGIGLGWCVLPEGIKRRHILGVGILAGVGFTMSIFITLLAFEDAQTITGAKIAVLLASLCAGLAGYLWLRITLPAGGSNFNFSKEETA